MLSMCVAYLVILCSYVGQCGADLDSSWSLPSTSIPNGWQNQNGAKSFGTDGINQNDLSRISSDSRHKLLELLNKDTRNTKPVNSYSGSKSGGGVESLMKNENQNDLLNYGDVGTEQEKSQRTFGLLNKQSSPNLDQINQGAKRVASEYNAERPDNLVNLPQFSTYELPSLPALSRGSSYNLNQKTSTLDQFKGDLPANFLRGSNLDESSVDDKNKLDISVSNLSEFQTGALPQLPGGSTWESQSHNNTASSQYPTTTTTTTRPPLLQSDAELANLQTLPRTAVATTDEIFGTAKAGSNTNLFPKQSRLSQTELTKQSVTDRVFQDNARGKTFLQSIGDHEGSSRQYIAMSGRANLPVLPSTEAGTGNEIFGARLANIPPLPNTAAGTPNEIWGTGENGSNINHADLSQFLRQFGLIRPTELTKPSVTDRMFQGIAAGDETGLRRIDNREDSSIQYNAKVSESHNIEDTGDEQSSDVNSSPQDSFIKEEEEDYDYGRANDEDEEDKKAGGSTDFDSEMSQQGEGKGLVEDIVDKELANRNKPPTGPSSMVLFYTWMVVAILVVVVAISTYQSRFKGKRLPSMRSRQQTREDKKRLLEHEYV